MPRTSLKVLVGTTGNSPEDPDRIKIAPSRDAASPEVVMSLGHGPNAELPMPDLRPGDLLRVFAELEVTTDAPVKNHPGRIGDPYTYAPNVEATLLLAADPEAAEEKRGRTIRLAPAWRGECDHDRHHRVIVFAGAELEVPRDGLPWRGDSRINVALIAHHPRAGGNDLLLVGQNYRDERKVGTDMAGIRAVRVRPGKPPAIRPEREERLRAKGVPVEKGPTVILSKRLDDLAEGEQLFVHGRLVTDAKPLGYHARITTRLFLADDPDDVEPAGHAEEIASWKGHLSKPNGFNCLKDEGPQRSEKFGVLRVRKPAKRPLHVNLVAASGAPFDDPRPDDRLPVDAGFVEVVRYPPDWRG